MKRLMKKPSTSVSPKPMQKLLLIAALALGWSAASWATTIEYTVTDLGSSNWEYSYTIKNDTSISNFMVATIYFPTVDVADGANQFTNILASTLTQPSGWTADQFPQGAGAGGYVDFYSPAAMAAGTSVSLLDVTFTYSGAGTPGSQFFEVYDNVNLTPDGTWKQLDNGNTVLAQQSPCVDPTQCGQTVPEPTTPVLFGISLVALAFARRKASVAALAA